MVGKDEDIVSGVTKKKSTDEKCAAKADNLNKEDGMEVEKVNEGDHDEDEQDSGNKDEESESSSDDDSDDDDIDGVTKTDGQDGEVAQEESEKPAQDASEVVEDGD